jgi:hypothetical protein
MRIVAADESMLARAANPALIRHKASGRN